MAVVFSPRFLALRPASGFWRVSGLAGNGTESWSQGVSLVIMSVCFTLNMVYFGCLFAFPQAWTEVVSAPSQCFFSPKRERERERE